MKNRKQDFPILKTFFKGHPLVYLDNAATTQKPKSVISAIQKYYETENANIHRGIYDLSEKATALYENTREKVKDFIHAQKTSEIIFTRNTTESINLVAYSWGEKNIKQNDEIVVSALEHHSNLVPYQELCHRKKAKLKIIPIDQNGNLHLKNLGTIITKKTKLVAITQMSNVLGTIVPLKKIISESHKKGALVLVDGAQGVPHLGINVKKLNCDFLVFSGHKMFGPSGVGVLYAKEKILKNMPPFLFGGNMIREVTQYKSLWNELPHKFEAGTPNIADVIAFSEAIKYTKKIGFKKIQEHETKLWEYARKKLATIPNLILYGSDDKKKATGIISFTISGIHPHDISSFVNEKNIAIRAGHHCAAPLMKYLGVSATARISFSVYNEKKDIDRLCEALKKIYKIFL